MSSLCRMWSLNQVLWVATLTSVVSMLDHCGNTYFGSTWGSCRITAQMWVTRWASTSTGAYGNALPPRTHRYMRRWGLAPIGHYLTMLYRVHWYVAYEWWVWCNHQEPRGKLFAVHTYIYIYIYIYKAYVVAMVHRFSLLIFLPFDTVLSELLTLSINKPQVKCSSGPWSGWICL
jgi:hypothetical protein